MEEKPPMFTDMFSLHYFNNKGLETIHMAIIKRLMESCVTIIKLRSYLHIAMKRYSRYTD